MSSQPDYYNILVVSTTATTDEIKKAFKKLALKHHPDKNSENTKEAEDVFKTINEAYQCLSDDQERAAYDRKRNIGRSRSEVPNFARHNASATSGHGWNVFEDHFGQKFGAAGSRSKDPFEDDFFKGFGRQKTTTTTHSTNTNGFTADFNVTFYKISMMILSRHSLVRVLHQGEVLLILDLDSLIECKTVSQN